MNVVKTGPIGIDIPIQHLQTYLYNALSGLWNGTYNAYGRAYRNQSADGYTPEVYVGNNEYNDVYFDDTLAVSSFFSVGEQTNVSKSNVVADVGLIFMINLSQIKPGTNRNDEEARVDVLKLVKAKPYGFTLSGIVIGIDQVFREYSGWKKEQGIKFRDTHPLHCFRINFKLNYNIYDY